MDSKDLLYILQFLSTSRIAHATIIPLITMRSLKICMTNLTHFLKNFSFSWNNHQHFQDFQMKEVLLVIMKSKDQCPTV